MTVQVKDFPTRKVMKREEKKMHDLGFIPLHTDFIQNDESKGYRVTFVNGVDDPSNSEEAKLSELKVQLESILLESLERDVITFKDLKMLLRIEHGLQLKQSTIDKLIIVKQGGFSGIVQRIKNLFNL